jgi:hypothetical protein
MMTRNEVIHYTISNLVSLLRANRMPFAIIVEDPTTGEIQSHSYIPVDSAISLHGALQVRIQDERRAS